MANYQQDSHCSKAYSLLSYTVQSRTVYAVIGCKLKQNANEGRNSCASLAGLVLCFLACFILLVIAPLENGNGNPAGEKVRP